MLSKIAVEFSCKFDRKIQVFPSSSLAVESLTVRVTNFSNGPRATCGRWRNGNWHIQFAKVLKFIPSLPHLVAKPNTMSVLFNLMPNFFLSVQCYAALSPFLSQWAEGAAEKVFRFVLVPTLQSADPGMRTRLRALMCSLRTIEEIACLQLWFWIICLYRFIKTDMCPSIPLTVVSICFFAAHEDGGINDTDGQQGATDGAQTAQRWQADTGGWTTILKILSIRVRFIFIISLTRGEV